MKNALSIHLWGKGLFLIILTICGKGSTKRGIDKRKITHYEDITMSLQNPL